MVLQFHFIVGENDEKVKRLLLNDPDVVGQISRMQNNMDLLTRELNTVKSELAAQKLRNTGKETCTRFNTIQKHTKIHDFLEFSAMSRLPDLLLKNSQDRFSEQVGV